VKNHLSHFAAGFLFAAGLVISGMTDPERVLAFLDVAGRWDPSLALVMGGAIVVYGAVRAYAKRMERPLAAERFAPLPSQTIDRRLVTGALIFGVGWGLAGYCPGPALVSSAAGGSQVIWFTLAMLGTFAITRMWDGRVKRSAARSSATGG
jgi:uncharacterized protein